MNPESPTALFNYFDIFLLLLLFLGNWILVKQKSVIINWKIYLPSIILLFVIFPLLSIKIEVGNVYRKYKMVDVDGFTLLYTMFRLPTWWAIGLGELIALKIIKKQRLDSQAYARK